ncbi:MAG TPA: AbrB family transcriptional regulator, partial [Casimicrobiaceae bacterium]|nr:AbrB family transcriptional regulator [Casimicrobiaceae bacterium]
MGRFVPQVAALAVAVPAGALFAWLHAPIPWMLGPLVATAACRIAGLRIEAPQGAREIGQWVIGTALGLYFTPAVIAHVREAWLLIAAGAAFALGVGYLSGALLARMAGLDLTTGVFAAVPGGAPEMARLAEKFGGRVDRVAAAQSMRILIVVASVPVLFTLAGAHGTDVFAMGTTTFAGGGFALLMAATLAGAFVADRLDVPNAFALGSLAVSIVLAALEAGLSSMPTLVSNAGQLLLGCALGG